MATLTRELLVAPKTKTVKVEGGEIVIRALRASEALEFQGKDLKGDDVMRIVALSIHEPEMTPDDVALIPIVIMNKIVVAIFAFNKLGAEAAVEAQNELKKTMG